MIIVGCGKAKRNVPSQARDLYVGTLFRISRCYAELTGGPWLVLSAAHGVVTPETWLRPYDQRVALGSAELTRWARLAADQIEQRLADPGERVEILAGRSYAGPVVEELARVGIVAVEPLAGLSMGPRLRRLNEMADQALEDKRRRTARGLQTAAGISAEEKEGTAG